MVLSQVFFNLGIRQQMFYVPKTQRQIERLRGICFLQSFHIDHQGVRLLSKQGKFRRRPRARAIRLWGVKNEFRLCNCEQRPGHFPGITIRLDHSFSGFNLAERFQSPQDCVCVG